MAENTAAVLYGPLDLRIVLVKMECVGICGTDVKWYKDGRCGSELVTGPMVIGHEGSGVVVQVGAKVQNLKVGDRVAIEPTQPCRSCEMCKRGKYNVCEKPRYCSTMDGPGNLCRYYKHVADFCYRIPDNMTMEEGAAVQPLAIAMHACNRAGVKIGTELVVLGAGPIGVLCAMTARAMGASKILITDVVQSRLDMAQKMGVDYTVLTRPGDSDQRTADTIVRTLGCRPDVTIDACGFAAAQRVALMIARTAGVVTVVGVGDVMVELPLTAALLREVDLRGSLRIAHTYSTALAAVSSGAINLKSFITHHFPMRSTSEAIQLANTGSAMKIIVHVQE